MDLQDALSQISEIRLRLTETERFRGYRSLPVAFSGLLAIVAAALQPYLIEDPHREILAYCGLWVGVAMLSMVAAALTMVLRDRFGGISQSREVTLLALSQLLPAFVAGGLVTAVIVRSIPAAVALLPGLWQVLFSLGLFASYRLLPRAIFAVALFFLLSGTITLALAGAESALNPWVMGLPFAVGQFCTSGVLYWNLERSDEKD
jgi:hypothetical protein